MEKVLLVDDEPDIRRIAEISFGRLAACEIILAATGEEALDLACRHRPDVILLDVMMPRLDGPATLALLREQAESRDIPVIFLTARTQRSEVEALLALGAAGVIAKPFDPMGLPTQVLRTLEAVLATTGIDE